MQFNYDKLKHEIDTAILATPSGELRNALCDVNLLLMRDIVGGAYQPQPVEESEEYKAAEVAFAELDVAQENYRKLFGPIPSIHDR
jgi:hypothetical protein